MGLYFILFCYALVYILWNGRNVKVNKLLLYSMYFLFNLVMVKCYNHIVINIMRSTHPPILLILSGPFSCVLPKIDFPYMYLHTPFIHSYLIFSTMIILLIFFSPIHRCLLALYTQYFPQVL